MEDKILTEIITTLLNNKAIDVCYFDASKVNPLYQYHIICSANSNTHAIALSNHVEEILEKNNIKINHVEGNNKSVWILVDGNDYVISIFVGDARNYYDLEKMYINQNIVRVNEQL